MTECLEEELTKHRCDTTFVKSVWLSFVFCSCSVIDYDDERRGGWCVITL